MGITGDSRGSIPSTILLLCDVHPSSGTRSCFVCEWIVCLLRIECVSFCHNIYLRGRLLKNILTKTEAICLKSKCTGSSREQGSFPIHNFVIFMLLIHQIFLLSLTFICCFRFFVFGFISPLASHCVSGLCFRLFSCSWSCFLPHLIFIGSHRLSSGFCLALVQLIRLCLAFARRLCAPINK